MDQYAEPERPDPRDTDRPEDRPGDDHEDDTDKAIKLAREHVIYCVKTLITTMQHDQNPDYRMKAAIALLEVAGCL